MKILHFSKSDNRGGAGIAALRLHLGLRNQGVDSRLVCIENNRNDFHIIGPGTAGEKVFAIFRGVLDRLPIYFYPRRKTEMFYPQWLPNNIQRLITLEQPDIVHLHWISGGFVRLESLCSIKQPLIWTMHDMWPFTGGCHYSEECSRYNKKCGRCPQLGSSQEKDLSRWIWNRKKKVFGHLNFTMVSPSRWLYKCATSSALLKYHRNDIIPYTIDLQRFAPVDRTWARSILNLPQDKKIILIGAENFFLNSRKGYQFIISSLKHLEDKKYSSDVHIAVFGASEPQIPPKIVFKQHYFGILNDEISISLLYAACDVFIMPSIQDNLPLTVMESLSCGTPVVSFNVGGIPDMIDHKNNGYLAKPFNTRDLAKGIELILNMNSDMLSNYKVEARKKVKDNFNIKQISDQYCDLYQSIL